MTDRRRTLLWLLVPLIPLPFIVGMFGAVGEPELLVWLSLIVVWVIVFLTWAKRNHVTTAK